MAIKTKGTQLYFVRPGTLDVVNLGCITAIENVGAPVQPRDVTPVESEWESSEPGMFSLGQIDLEIRFDPSSSGHMDVLDMYEGRVTANFAIGLGDGASPPQIDDGGEFVSVGGRSFLAFRGWIMDVPFSFPLNENVPVAVSIMQVPSLVPGVLGVGLLPAEAGIPCASDSEYDGGEAFPSEVSVVLGSGAGWVAIEYLPGPRPDKFEVWLGGQLVFDSGYVGDVTWQNDLNAALANRGLPPEVIRQRVGTGGSVSGDWPDPAERERGYFYKGTADAVATVRVYAPLPGTAWVFRLGCPDPHEYAVITESGTWTPPEGVTRGDVLVVGAGGGGGARQGGGGGGGRVIFEQGVTFGPGEPIPVTVGAGGIGVVGSRGEKGGDTTFGDIVAEGGGYGGGRSDPLHRAGGDGGSGGGASSDAGDFRPGGAGSVGPGYGNDGGSASHNSGGGGGGGGQPGGPGSASNNGRAGNGGNGADLSAYFGIDFNAVFGFTVGEYGWFGGGGGGSAVSSQYPSGMGRGGFGGGGDGDGQTTATPGKPAKPRTGGGGGGGAQNGGGGAGSDGVVVVRWLPLHPEGSGE